ncbi:MAG: hypothetical protein LAO04_18340 [Acidobacteriia bacterium]|nr:hypothetical protein [Terriglobia bacterium]
MLFNCWKCGGKIEYPAGSRVLRADACPQCDSDLHSCRNCQFYDPGKHNQCAGTQAEWVGDKGTANCCDYFQPNPTLLASTARPASQANDAKNRFDSLFKV